MAHRNCSRKFTDAWRKTSKNEVSQKKATVIIRINLFSMDRRLFPVQ